LAFHKDKERLKQHHQSGSHKQNDEWRGRENKGHNPSPHSYQWVSQGEEWKASVEQKIANSTIKKPVIFNSDDLKSIAPLVNPFGGPKPESPEPSVQKVELIKVTNEKKEVIQSDPWNSLKT